MLAACDTVNTNMHIFTLMLYQRLLECSLNCRVKYSKILVFADTVVTRFSCKNLEQTLIISCKGYRTSDFVILFTGRQAG